MSITPPEEPPDWHSTSPPDLLLRPPLPPFRPPWIPASPSSRHKCPACFKQYKKKEHLIDHMRVSYHSIHQPKCGICKKHCKSLESVREHLTGPLAKGSCSEVFKNQGCSLCLKVFYCSDALAAHKDTCCLSPSSLLQLLKDVKELSLVEKSKFEIGDPGSAVLGTNDHDLDVIATDVLNSDIGVNTSAKAMFVGHYSKVVAMDCEMVGGGSDGSLDLCARICIIDEDESVIFHSFVKPQIPVTDYRSGITGLTEDLLAEAPPLELVKWKVEEILYNKESIARARLCGGRARILVGHTLDHDLDCLRLNYPNHLIRDTARYSPLMKTNLVSHPLKYLARTYLGYEIQSGIHDPYEDCVAALRVYKRMRSEAHQLEANYLSNSNYNSDSYKENAFNFCNIKELEEKSPEELLEMSCSNYRCWCMDAKAAPSGPTWDRPWEVQGGGKHELFPRIE